MKHFILLSLLFPLLSFGQVKMENLSRKNGLAYENGSSIPFTGKAISYFPNGDIQTTLEYKDGIPNGELNSWYKKDIKQIEGVVENGKKTGTWKLYFESGKLKKQSAFQNDTENGEEIFYFENGNIEKKGSYLNGKLNGKYEWYFENGRKEQEGFYVNGQKDGAWYEWFENGKPKMVGNFKDIEKDGAWTWWDKKGKITESKNYKNGLIIVDKDNFDTYLEKMEFYLSKKDFNESLKYVELAEATIKDKTDDNPIYMGVIVYHSKCYSNFFHYKQGEKVLLDAIGLTVNQSETIQNSHLEKSPEKINQVITEISEKDKQKFQISNHIALALCYNILGDTIRLKNEQQLMTEKGKMQDWIINISLELYKLAGERFNSYAALEDIIYTINKKGSTKELELYKAQCLLRTEKFEEAQTIVDKYLNANDKNLKALILKANIEMAYGNVDSMKIYEDKALAIDPNAFSTISD